MFCIELFYNRVLLKKRKENENDIICTIYLKHTCSNGCHITWHQIGQLQLKIVFLRYLKLDI